MNPQSPDEPLNDALSRYTTLLKREEMEGRSSLIASEAIQELSTVLEELRVAEDDLRIQNSLLLDANEMLARERGHQAELFSHLPVAFFVTSVTGAIVQANQRAHEMLAPGGHPPDGKPVTVFVAERARREFRHMVNRIANGEVAEVSFSTVLGRNPANERVVQVDASAFEVDGARHISWLLRHADPDTLQARKKFDEEHTSRLSTERTLRQFRFLTEATRRLTGERDVSSLCSGVVRAVTRHAADHSSIYLIEGSSLVCCASADADADKGVLADALRRRFGITPDTLDGMLWRAILTGDPQAHPAVAETIEAGGARSFFMQLREQGPRNAVVIPLRRRDHSIGALVALNVSPIASLHAEDVGVLSEAAVRTALAIENAQLMNKLERANEEKVEFMAVLSHELRTPLTAVIGYADLLLSGAAPELGPQARQHVQRIRSSAWHQLTIVEQVLTHTRRQSSSEAMARERVGIADVINEVCGLVASSATAKGLTLEVDVSPSLILVTDGGRLRQILINLLSNAVKYTERGGIEVKASGSDDEVAITVTDTGLGIGTDALAQVFEAYWRGHPSKPGVGLGLNVSQKLAQHLGGEITVESEPGKGTTFTLRLPTE